MLNRVWLLRSFKYTSGQGQLFPESLFLLCFLSSSNQSHSVCNSFSLCEVPNKLLLSSRNCWLPLGFCNRPHPQLEDVSGEKNLPSNPFNKSLGTLCRKLWVAFISPSCLLWALFWNVHIVLMFYIYCSFKNLVYSPASTWWLLNYGREQNARVLDAGAKPSSLLNIVMWKHKRFFENFLTCIH